MPEKDLLTIFSFPKYMNSRDVWNIFSVFSAFIWLLILASYVFYGLLHVLMNFSKNSLEAASRFIDVFGVLVGQGDAILLNRNHLGVNPLIVFVLMSFILRQFFGQDITALLLTRTKIIIDYFSQLETYDFTILIEDQSNYLHYFQQLFPKLMPKLKLIEHDEVNSESTMFDLVHQPFVLVTDGTTAEMMRNFYSAHKFHISEQGFVSSFGNFAIRKSLNNEMKRKLSQM